MISEAVEAIGMILDMLPEATAELKASADLRIASTVMGHLIVGEGGVIINAIRNESEARIIIPLRHDQVAAASDSENRDDRSEGEYQQLVRVTGRLSQVVVAMRIISDRLETGRAVCSLRPRQRTETDG